jgi:hypothetical protein
MYHILSYVSGGIFGRLDIMYHILSYVSGGALPLKPLVLYIYRLRGTMNQSSNYSLACHVRRQPQLQGAQLPGKEGLGSRTWGVVWFEESPWSCCFGSPKVYVDNSCHWFGIVSPCCCQHPNVDPLENEVVVACSPSYNGDACSQAIFVGVVSNLGGGTTHALLLLPCWLMVRVASSSILQDTFTANVANGLK